MMNSLSRKIITHTSSIEPITWMYKQPGSLLEDSI